MMVCRGHTRTLNGGEPIWNEIVVGEQLWGRGEGMATGNRGRSQRGEEGDTGRLLKVYISDHFRRLNEDNLGLN